VVLNQNDYLIGYFYDSALAEAALNELRQDGFRDDQLQATLCEAELAPSPAWVGPHSVGASAGLVAGGLIGAFLGPAGGLAASLWIAILLGILVFGGIGILLGTLVGWAIDSEDVDQPRTPIYLSRGIVTVRPEGRDTAAATILRRLAGCEPSPAIPPGRRI
jgi:hypothetical protein